MPEYSNILCCTDFSHNAECAFEEAKYLASLAAARLFLLHVIHAGVGEAALAMPVSQREAEEAELLSRLKATYESRATDGLHIAVSSGDVTTEILEFAADVHAEVIVIGARGIGRLEGFLGGGSIAARLVRHSTVPVLVVGVSGHAPTRRHHELPQAVDLPLFVKEMRETQEQERSARERETV